MLIVLLVAVVALVGAAAGESSENAVQLQKDLDAAIARSAPTFHIPSGDYTFGTSSFVIQGATNLEIVADEDGVTVWFEIGGGVLFESCTNTSFRGNGMKVDYDPLPFFQATVINVSSGSSIHEFDGLIQPDAGSPDPIAFYDRYTSASKTNENEFVQGPQWWDGSAGLEYPLLQSSFSGFNATSQVKRTTRENVFRYIAPLFDRHSVMPRPAARGDKVTVVIRDGFTWNLHKCEGVVTQNVTIHSSSFMAITEFDGRGANVYSDISVVRRAVVKHDDLCGVNKTRVCLALVASNADVFHSSGLKKGPKVTGCEFSFAMDDFVNVHSRVQVSTDISGDTSPTDGSGTIKLLVADPRETLDRRAPDDFTYGVVETMPNAAPGDSFSLRSLQRLELVAEGKIISLERLANALDPLAVKAQDMLDDLDSGKPTLLPGFKPMEITGDDVSAPRAWVVTVKMNTRSGVAAVLNQTLLFELTEWNNGGSVFSNNLLHNSIDGFRWKSSNGNIIKNVWKTLRTFPPPLTGLELTPLRSFLEGPLAISNVSIQDNVFEGPSLNSTFITECEGMSHDAMPRFTSCTGIVKKNNSFVARPTVKIDFEPPVIVHRSFDGQHAWFSSLLQPSTGPTNGLLLDMSLGGDGTPCPPPGGPPQNCSMMCGSADGGKSWQPLPDWGHVSSNEVIPLPNGSFVSLGYSMKVEGPSNTTALQGTWTGHFPSKRNQVVVLGRSTARFDVGKATNVSKWPPTLVHSGSVVELKDGSFLTTLYGHGTGTYRKWNQRPAVFFVRSTDLGRSWTLQAVIPWTPAMGNTSDGPGEPTTTRMKDGRLLCIFRSDATESYWKAWSGDEGKSWSSVGPLGNGNIAWSVKPRVRVAGNGVVLLSGGRPGIDLWASGDGGETFTRFNIAAIHNRLIPYNSTSVPPFSQSVVNADSPHTPRANPPGTSSYTGLAFAADGSLVISYDRLANGWKGPPGKWGEFDALFTMRAKVTLVK